AERVADARELDQVQGDGGGALDVGDVAREDQVVAAQDDPAAAEAGHLLEIRVADAREQQQIGALRRDPMLDRAVLQWFHQLLAHPVAGCGAAPAPPPGRARAHPRTGRAPSSSSETRSRHADWPRPRAT